MRCDQEHKLFAKVQSAEKISAKEVTNYAY
jgi:hypothetical protein